MQCVICAALIISPSYDFRMKVFLMLLMTLVFTHGLAPCQRHQDYSAYSNFTHRHILSENFDVNNQRDWVDYLNRTALCERVPIQSFLRGVDTNNIRSICNGQGIRDRGNLCVSNRRFTVYIVESVLRNKQCQVIGLNHDEYYVIVACDIAGNQCLPVHYETQINNEQHGPTCGPNISTEK